MSTEELELSALLEKVEINDSQKETFDKLKELDQKVVNEDEELSKLIMKLEAEFRAKVAPILKERDAVITSNNIADFWLRALINNRSVRDMIEKHDIPILKHLTNITIEHATETQSFSINFTFSPNEYFTNSFLKKEYTIVLDNGMESFDNVTSTTIEWKEGKDITKKTVTTVQRNKRTNQTRNVSKTVDVPSFFLFFRSYTAPTEESVRDMDPAEIEQLHILMQSDFEAARKIKEYIVPRAVTWYLGEGEDSDDEDDYDGDEYDEEDDEEDEDGEDEDGDDNDAGASKKKEECKQQ